MQEEPGDDVPAEETAPLGDVQPVVRSGGRARWAAAFVALVALLVGLVALVGSGSDDDDADAALARAQQVVADSGSYRFEVLRRDRVVVGDPDGAGSDTTTRSVTRGEVAAADRWHVADDAGDSGYRGPDSETTRVGDQVFYRWAEDPELDQVVGPAWDVSPVGDDPSPDDLASMYASIDGPCTMYGPGGEAEPCEPDPEFEAQQKLALVVDGYLLPVSADPEHAKRLVLEATDPMVEEHLPGGGLRLRARLAPIPEIAEAANEPLPPVDLVLDLDPDDRPTAARFSGALDAVSSDVEVRYRGWGEPIEVAAPPDADVDHTPWIEEEVLAQHPELLMAPEVLPPGFVLSGASSWSMLDDACPSVDLSYGTAEELAFFTREDVDEAEANRFFEDLEHFAVTVVPASCEESTAVVVDDFGSEEGLHRTVHIGDALVTIDTSITDEALLDAVAASVRRYSVEELAAMIPAAARTSFPGGGPGGWFAYGP